MRPQRIVDIASFLQTKPNQTQRQAKVMVIHDDAGFTSRNTKLLKLKEIDCCNTNCQWKQNKTHIETKYGPAI